jgi:hypothetical protein
MRKFKKSSKSTVKMFFQHSSKSMILVYGPKMCILPRIQNQFFLFFCFI